MSRQGSNTSNLPESLKNVFQRMQVTSDHIEITGKVLNHLIDWHSQVSDLLNDLPETTENQISKEIRHLIPLLQTSVEEKARTGAREGISYSQTTLETLREVKDDYKTKRYKITKTAFIGLPVAFGIAILCGFLFGSTVIAVLPSSWQWTCTLVGAQHMRIQSSGEAVCVIQK